MIWTDYYISFYLHCVSSFVDDIPYSLKQYHKSDLSSLQNELVKYANRYPPENVHGFIPYEGISNMNMFMELTIHTARSILHLSDDTILALQRSGSLGRKGMFYKASFRAKYYDDPLRRLTATYGCLIM